MIYLPTEPDPPQKVAFGKATISICLTVGSLTTICCLPYRNEVCVAAPAIFFAATLINLRQYEKLEKQAKEEVLASSISSLEKPEMTEEGRREGLARIQVAMWKKFRK